jgi:hypothetical protein
MKRHALLAVLAGMTLLGMWTLSQQRSGDGPQHPLWTIFLILLPVGLAAAVWRNFRWAAMASVIYGTVGLALDFATAVQVITEDTEIFAALASSAVSGLLNFLLIVFGGQAFLDVSQAPPPPESRPPSPPSPFSSFGA